MSWSPPSPSWKPHSPRPGLDRPARTSTLGKSKKIWEEEVGPKKKEPELTEGTQQVQAPTQQAAPQAQPAQQPNQVNGQGDGLPPTHTAN